MGQSIQSGVQSITGSVTASVSAIPATMLSTKYVLQNAAGTIAIGTVPANKEWYIVAANVSVSVNHGATARSGTSKIQANAVDILAVCLDTSASAGVGGSSSTATMTAPLGTYIGAALTAGQVVNLVTSVVNNNNTGVIWYYEKSV